MKGRLSTVDFPIEAACIVTKVIICSISKAAGLNLLVQGGQQY